MNVVALIPAYNAAARIGATVRATGAIPGVARVLVVDDASTDATADAARAAGAEVLCLPGNRGKGGAVLAGVAASPDADVFLLVDADLEETATETARLLPPVLADEADMTIAVLPPAAGRGGFGKVRDMAAGGIRRACGFEARAPLSGQRAVRAELLRQLDHAERFGLEVALTIDAVRSGARVVEIEAEIEHEHTGRSLAGFRHRGRQGVDILRSLWPRLTRRSRRLGALVAIAVLLVAAMLWSGNRWEPTTEPLTARPDRVVVFGMTPFDFADIDAARTPTLDRIQREGAMGAMTVRTVARRPSITEGYLSLGAGARLRATSGAGTAYPFDRELGSGTAGEILERITGGDPEGEIAVVGAPSSIRANQGVEVASDPGALADALHEAGHRTAVVGLADHPAQLDDAAVEERPAALAVMSSDLTVDTGSIDPDELLLADPYAPYGVRADPDAMIGALQESLETASLVVVDPGDLQRASAFRRNALPDVGREATESALRRTDALLGRVIESVGPDTLVYVVSVAPRSGSFRLTPVYAVGAGVPEGSWLTSPSTKRTGLVALTDIAPTITDALTGEVPVDLPGNAIRFEDGPADLDFLLQYDRETNVRERTYYAQAQLFIAIQAVVYAAVAITVSRRREGARSGAAARWFVLAVASYPVSTFLVQALSWATTSVALPSLIAIGLSALVATLASRRRGHALAGFDLVLALTVAVIVVDAATGTNLNVSSWLGYSLHSAGRFYGMPNTTFAVLGAATLLLATSWVHRSVRRDEAVAASGVLFLVVALANGLPFLGGDVGGIITFVPVFGLTLWALAGRRIRLRTLVVFGLGTVVVLVAVAGIDLLRPEESRTHLGRFADEMLEDGFAPLIETFLRKQAANFRIFRVSIWTWMIPIVVSFLLYLLAWGRGWRRLLPLGSAIRVGAISVLSAALFGFVANDSGPIVIALFFVYLLAFLALLVLDPSRERDPILLGPSRASAAGPGT